MLSLMIASGIHANAYQNGITGQTTAGCGGGGCHSGTPSNTSLSISGTTTLSAGQQTTLTLTIQNSSRPRSGCDIDFINSSNTKISGLALVSGQGMSLSNNELTHSTPKTISSGQSTWQFNLTAPSTPGAYTLRIAGNATTSQSSSDYTTTTQSIIVKGLTLTAPTGGQTYCGGSAISIQWTSYGVSNINLQMSSDGGANYSTVSSTASSNGSNSYNYTLPISTPSGTNYRFRIVDAADATLLSAMSANFSVGSGVSITTQPTPASQTVCQGSNVIYSVNVSGPNPTYQWRKDGQNLNGATAAALNLTNVTPTQAGSYDCVVSSSCGAPVTSTPVNLSVDPAAAITTQPQSQTICEGGTAIFTVVGTGNSLTYKWQKNGTDIPGATTASYTVRTAQTSDAGQYTCIVTGSCGAPATSSPANLGIVSPPVFSTNPASAVKCEGANVTFSAAVANTNGVTYEWVKDGVTLSANARITGVNTPNLTINTLQASDGGSYQLRAVATACQAVVLSGSALLGVNAAPPITSQPQSKVVSVGASVTFTVSAVGATLTYQWKKNGTAINGETNASYTIASAAKSNEGSYTCVVSNACASTTSAAANLTVSDLPQPVLSLSVSTITCGTLKVGAQKTVTFEVSNTGTAKLDVSATSLSGDQSGSYSVDAAAFSLDPAAKKTVTVTFSPKSVGANVAKVAFTSNSSGTSEVSLSGNGVLRALTPDAFSFGSAIEVGKTKDSTVQICNNTSEDLVIQAVVPSGDITSFSFTGTPIITQLPLTLKKDSCVTIALRFNPTKEGNLSLNVDFTTSQGKDAVVISGSATPSSSVEFDDATAIQLIPNPASDRIRISMPGSETITGVSIVDMLGNRQLSLELSNSNSVIPVQSLNSGMYRVVIETAAHRYSLPLSIVR